jgi:hypothetical protein
VCVVVDDHVVPEHLLDGIAAVRRYGAAAERRVSQQPADNGELAVVNQLGVVCDEALDRPAARFLIGQAHPPRA